MDNLLPFFKDETQAVQKVMREVKRRELAHLRRERREMGRMSLNGRRGVRMPDGTQATFSVPPHSYHYWGKRLGYECWQDAGFIHEFLRDNPQCRITNVAEKPLIGWTPQTKAAQYYRQNKIHTIAAKQKAVRA